MSRNSSENSFSQVIQINTIDDYIAPAQACIKPVKIDKSVGKTRSIKVEEDGSYTALTEDGSKYILQKASISLNDCLACSGCITSAETILVSEHSSNVFSDVLLQNKSKKVDDRSIVVVTLSPQTISNLLAHISTYPRSKLAKMFLCFRIRNSLSESDVNTFRTFVASCLLLIGVHLITDVTWARDICLYEAGLEFIEHFTKQDDICAKPLPLFSSICPGWICYAEKNPLASSSSLGFGHGEFSFIPHISNVRSPQQIAGRIIKLIGEEKCFHISIMPCFDKKLEASREEFSVPSRSVPNCHIPDVDLVLATNELLDLLESFIHESGDTVFFSADGNTPELGESQRFILNRLYEIFRVKPPIKPNFGSDDPLSLVHEMFPMYRHSGSGSGGYAAYIFRVAGEKLFSLKLKPDILTDKRVLIRQLQNQDIQELLLFSSKEDRNLAEHLLSSLPNRIPYRHFENQPKALLVFAIANGFRNIQTVVQYLRKMYQFKNCDKPGQIKFKQTRACYPFDYVEVMACPNGCLNGGGQIKEILTQTSELYTSLMVRDPMSNDLVQDLYELIKSKDPDLKCLYTTYKTVPQIEIINPSALKW
ncbi:hypothetical protein MN116_003796 [Schistosoma mekongi]|uniref:Iron hydrogenase large subunit C-terminal domain-containing protein n=1 Tax=Schistosoma mekongi TaxID=38744 RepID=A0AAE2D618_SCHME|nr:hypothetical protein MN116_003796 [Schistosoma mekongi]